MGEIFSGYFLNRNRNWFYIFGSIFIVLAVVYAILHYYIEGEEIVNFSKQEIANIETIVDNSNLPNDTTAQNKRNLTQIQRDNIKANVEQYILSRYNLSGSDSESINDLRLFLTQYANADFPTTFLNEFKLHVHSYFWLTEDLVFLEVMFWSLFGVLCSLFYYISEAIANGTYKAKHEYVHAAKLFYAPATTLVVYFSINALISNGEVNLNNLRYGLIILSYILGFFSARTIELLSRIKDLLLPAGKRVVEYDSDSNQFEALSSNEQQKLIEDAIKENENKWKLTYPNLVNVSIGNNKSTSIVNGKEQTIEQYFILFQIFNQDNNLSNSIPSNIEYKGYKIPVQTQIGDFTNTSNANQNSSPKQFDQLSLDEQYNIVQQAVELHAKEWLDQYPLTGVAVGKKRIKDKELQQYCIVFQVNKKSNDEPELPPYFEFKQFLLPTDVQEFGITTAVLGKNLESGVSRINENDYGTLGIPVTDGFQDYILSCYHVYFSKELKNGYKRINRGQYIGDRQVVCPCFKERINNKDDIIGEVVEGTLDDWLDIGVIKANNNFTIEKQFKLHPGPIGMRLLQRSDEKILYLKYWGNGSKRIRFGRVLSTFTAQKIEYNDRPYIAHIINGLIQMEGAAVGGDSGSPVVDPAGNVVGIVAGSDDTTTYIIPAFRIETNSSYKIKYI